MKILIFGRAFELDQKSLFKSLFRAFLLKNGEILNYGKTQIGQLTLEGHILAQKYINKVYTGSSKSDILVTSASF